MRRRVTAMLAAALVGAACGGTPAPGNSPSAAGSASPKASPTASATYPGPSSSQRIASDPGDVPGTKYCPATGLWPQFLAYLQGTDPAAYRTAQDDWNKLLAAGATDGYIAIHADNLSECGALDHQTQTQGRVVNVAAVHFKDEATAVSAYRGPDGPLGIDVAALQNLGASGSVNAGPATGLGENSIEAATTLGGGPFFAAYWQHGPYAMAIVAFDTTPGDGEAIAKRVDGRA